MLTSAPQDNLNYTSEEQGLDFAKVLWRWKWFTALGAVIGGALGYLQFSREEPTYRSSAMVQVVYPSSDAPGFDTMDSPEQIRGKSGVDESLIIKSARVVDLAIEMGDLQEHPRFHEMNRLAIRKWILGGRRLEVNPAGRDSSTALIEVSFVCEDPELSRVIVDSVIGGYDHYLEEAYRSLGTEVNRIVTQAQDKLRESYEDLAAKHAKFRKAAPMIWLGDEARNQFAENNIKINSSINDIEIERQKIQAILQHIAEAQNQNRPADGILVMLSSDPAIRRTLMLDESELNNSATTPKPMNRLNENLPFSSSERRRLLMELQIEEQELLDIVGEQHPAVASVRRKIELLDRQITVLVDSELRIQTENMAADTGEIDVAEMNSEQKLELWKKSLAERIAALHKQEILLEGLASENESKSKELQEYLTRNNLFNSELASLQTLLKVSTDTLNRIQITPDTSRLSLETLTPPAVGGFYGPMWLPYIFGGAALGFVAVAGLAVLVDWMDQSFRGPQEISQTLGLQILGHVPQMVLSGKPSEHGLDPALCTYNGGFRGASEAIRAIRTNLYFAENGQSNRVIQVTSPAPGDGKSTLASNIAISIAQSGRSVLLIDADMRRPRVAKLFGLTDTEGVGEVILGDATLAAATITTPIKNLSILASSQPTSNPSELVSHQRFQDILDEVRQAYDYVIIDTPPVLAVADASAVSARADGVILTLRLRRDAKPTALEAANTLKAVGARVLGIVVNGVSGTEGYAYGYRSYGYSGEDDVYGEFDQEPVNEEPREGVIFSNPSGLPTPNLTHMNNVNHVD